MLIANDEDKLNCLKIKSEKIYLKIIQLYMTLNVHQDHNMDIHHILII